MEFLVAFSAAALACLAMWPATAVQHRLYTLPEHRIPGDHGYRRLIRRLSISIAAALAVGFAARPGHYDPLPAIVTAVAILGLLLAASTDLERRLIPNRLSYALALFAVAVCWVWPDRSVVDVAIGAGAALGIGVGLFVFGEVFAIALRVRVTPFGMGDVKLILVLGLLTGWPALLSALLLGVGSAGVPALALTLAGRGRRVFPYGPFLVLGGVAALVWPARFV